MALPVADFYGCPSGGVIAAGCQYASPFWRNMAQGWNEIVIGGTKPHSSIVNFSGMALDERGGKIYLFGGGHFDYWGNEVWTLDLEARSLWAKDYVPDFDGMNPSYSGTIATDTTYQYAKTLVDNTNWPGAIVVGGVPVRPINRHTYNTVHWIPTIGKMVAGGGSTWSGSGERYWTAPGGVPDVWWNAPSDNWLYDPVAKTWEFKGSARKNAAYEVSGSICCVHPTTGHMFSVGKDANSRLNMRRWNPDDNTYVLMPGNAAGTVYSSFTCCVDTKRNRVIVAARYTGAVDLWAYDIASNTWAAMSASGSIPADMASVAQITWSPVTDSILMLRGSAAGLDKYDCQTGVWSNSAIPVTNLIQVQGRWIFDTRRKVALLVYRDSTSGIRVFAYKE